MNKVVKSILRLFFLFVLIIVVGFIVFLLYSHTTYFQPEELEELTVEGSGSTKIKSDTLSFLDWNIGYSGLGKEMDFFYEGGKMVRPDKIQNKNYTNGIIKILDEYKTVDFVLLQEVDLNSKRSYHINQAELIQNIFDNHVSVFARNYVVKHVPMPVFNPLGKVESGIMLLSSVTPFISTRHAFPQYEKWPMKLFLLNRCLIQTRYKVGQHELIVINTHNTAFDETLEANTVQLQIIKNIIAIEYKKGNYIVAGGDWNQNPPDYDVDKITTGDNPKLIQPLIPENHFPKGWKWVYDPSVPTNREIGKPYTKGESPATIIDFYLVSPNIEVLEVKTINTGFAHTDHHPVYIKVVLKKSINDKQISR